MIVLKHIQQLVDLALPPENAFRCLIEEIKDIFKPQARKHSYQRECLRQRIVSQIKPIKFGNATEWASATSVACARYDIPRTPYLVVLRVETYSVDLATGATDFNLYQPPPPGAAYWQTSAYGYTTGTTEAVTDTNAPTHLALDCDEFLIFQGGQEVTLLGVWSVAPADGNTRAVRTLAYAYEVGPEVIERIYGQQALITTNN